MGTTPKTGLQLRLDGSYYDPSTGRTLRRAEDDGGLNEYEASHPYWFTRLANAVRPLQSLGLQSMVPGLAAVGVAASTIVGLNDSTVEFGRMAGLNDAGKASTGDVLWAGTKWGVQVVGVATAVAAPVGAIGALARVEAVGVAGDVEVGIEELSSNLATNGGCFVVGTPVQVVVQSSGQKGTRSSLAKSTKVATRPIERMKAGDVAVSRNPATGKTEPKRVVRTTVRRVARVLTIHLADGKTGREVEAITATGNHPFYVSGVGFVEAERLGIGCQIVTRAGPALVVQAVEWQRRPEGYLVYNFEVQDDHTYFVGTANGGVWVHNPDVNCLEPLGGKAPEQVTPGIRQLEGQYVNDIGHGATRVEPWKAHYNDIGHGATRVEPWKAHYDEYGRIIARTDYNAANRAAGIPAVHHHLFEYRNGVINRVTGHIPGEYVPH